MEVPSNYRLLDGSERRPGSTATLISPAQENERFEVTVVLRRRVDGPAAPGPDNFLLPPRQRPRLSDDDFTSLYGASPQDMGQVTDFVTSHGLSVVESNAARRTVVVSGTVKQMSRAFIVEL